MEISSNRAICLVVHCTIAGPLTSARAQDGCAVWIYLLHLEHVKSTYIITTMTFGQAIELRRPQTEDIKRILCCRVKGSDATCGALKYAN
jgi:hypothetical protein